MRLDAYASLSESDRLIWQRGDALVIVATWSVMVEGAIGRAR